MAVQRSTASSRRRARFPSAEAFGLVPVVALLATLLWLAFVPAAPAREAGLRRGTTPPALQPANTWQGADREDHLLILVTFSDERASELDALVKAEAALRDLLEEPMRNVELVAAPSREEAESILKAIQTDGNSLQLGVHVEGALVP